MAPEDLTNCLAGLLKGEKRYPRLGNSSGHRFTVVFYLSSDGDAARVYPILYRSQAWFDWKMLKILYDAGVSVPEVLGEVESNELWVGFRIRAITPSCTLQELEYQCPEDYGEAVQQINDNFQRAQLSVGVSPYDWEHEGNTLWDTENKRVVFVDVGEWRYS